MNGQGDAIFGQTEALRRLGEIGNEAARSQGADFGLVMASMREQIANLDDTTRAQLEDALKTMRAIAEESRASSTLA